MTDSAVAAGELPPADSPRAKWGKGHFGYRANTAILWVGTRFLWAGYALVALAAAYFFLCVPRARKASIRYLGTLQNFNGLPRRSFLRRWFHTYRHMFTFGILLLDRALMLARPAHGFSIDCQGLVHLNEALTAGGGPRGVLLLSAHFGMAEIAAPYMRRMGMHRPVNIVMYQDSKDSTEKFHARHRHMMADMAVISTTDPLAAGVKIIAALKRAEVVALRADRTLAGKGIRVTLLGTEVLLPAGPFVTAALSDAPIIHIYTCRMGYRHYRCLIASGGTFGESSGGTRDQRVERAAKSFAAHLEKTLQEHPYQWSNFYDFWSVQKP